MKSPGPFAITLSPIVVDLRETLLLLSLNHARALRILILMIARLVPTARVI